MFGYGAGVDDSYVERVLGAVEAVPPGRVTSYGDLAALLGDGGPRRIALVLSRHGAAVAWWRVVRTNGSAAPLVRDRARGAWAAEGTPTAGDRINMARARLRPIEWAQLRPDLAAPD